MPHAHTRPVGVGKVRKKGRDPFECLRIRLLDQLDSLVPFLALSHREIFNVLKMEYAGWYTDDRRSTLPNTLNEYSHQVAHAAFLLGYSYAEAFVTDLICEVYSARRDLLPKEKHLPFGEVLLLTDFEEVVKHMIESMIAGMNSLEAKILHLERSFGWQIPQAAQLRDAHVARNALVHYAGYVNREPPEGSRWHSGDRIELSANDVHEFGIIARAFVRELCEQAKAICGRSKRSTRSST